MRYALKIANSLLFAAVVATSALTAPPASAASLFVHGGGFTGGGYTGGGHNAPLGGVNQFLSGHPSVSPYHSVPLGGVNQFLSGRPYVSPYHSVPLGGANQFLSGHPYVSPYHSVPLAVFR